MKVTVRRSVKASDMKRSTTIGVSGFVLFVVALVILFNRQHPGNPNEILVLCGGSMRAPLEEIIGKYAAISPDKVVATYGGSGDLCVQIEKTGKGDLYLCHDPFMEWAQDRGLIVKWRKVGEMKIVIVVPAGNPKKIKTLKDLARPGIRLGIGNRTYSTSGRMIMSIFNRLPYGPDILKNVRMETKGHQQRCTDVRLGTLDAAIVWLAVAHLYERQLDIIAIPSTHLDTITSATGHTSDLGHVKVAIGITARARDNIHARKFYDFVLACDAIFRKYHFQDSVSK